MLGFIALRELLRDRRQPSSLLKRRIFHGLFNYRHTGRLCEYRATTHASHQASSKSSLPPVPCSGLHGFVSVLSLVIHSRIYRGQFVSSVPLASAAARSFTASRSARR